MLDPLTQARYRELAAWMAQRHHGTRCATFGINGAQGSGKSTAAAFLKDELATTHGLRTVVVSLDDFYLPRAARQALAATQHPLFVTRGVPGTHDVELGIAVFEKLGTLGQEEQLSLPRFSKAEDDRMPRSDWSLVEGSADVILFEGWCVGTRPQADVELDVAINELEATEDADGRWRRMVNDRLRTSYADWFARLDAQVFIAVPDFACVARWRWQQEQDTARAAAGGSASHLQSRTQLGRFIQHYERLTRHALRTMPGQADAVLMLRDDHSVEEIRFPCR
jgi:D-glycerate 3-kinase